MPCATTALLHRVTHSAKKTEGCNKEEGKKKQRRRKRNTHTNHSPSGCQKVLGPSQRGSLGKRPHTVHGYGTVDAAGRACVRACVRAFVSHCFSHTPTPLPFNIYTQTHTHTGRQTFETFAPAATTKSAKMCVSGLLSAEGWVVCGGERTPPHPAVRTIPSRSPV